MYSSNLATSLTNTTRPQALKKSQLFFQEAYFTQGRRHNISSQLGYYLAGLIESDGTIIVPKEGSSNTPKIDIVFNIKDKPLALHIKKFQIMVLYKKMVTS